jgi:hypothetical protein
MEHDAWIPSSEIIIIMVTVINSLQISCIIAQGTCDTSCFLLYMVYPNHADVNPLHTPPSPCHCPKQERKKERKDTRDYCSVQ